MPSGPPTEKEWSQLKEAALNARHNAYAPYSRFRVGAALLCDDGSVVTGCNIENASYGLCICAERCAVGTAVADGKRSFRGVAIATGSSPPSTPCGMCRQTLAEFEPRMPIALVNDKGEAVSHRLDELFPGSFNLDQLKDGADGGEGDK